MITFSMKNLTSEFVHTLGILGKRYDFSLEQEGRVITPVQVADNVLRIKATPSEVVIEYNKLGAFYRGIGIAVQKAQEGIITFEEEANVYFDMNGLMIDCSRNGVLNVSYTKEVIEQLAIMGHSVMMLYMEDVYAVEEEEYFGYMRGRYSKKELMELDDYAHQFGIEMIPCIQTLAHLDQFFAWQPVSENYADLDNILFVGHKDVNELLERLIKHLSETFRSRRIHLGMDEAYNLGRGRYADKHGLRPKTEIMQEHLNQLLEITGKYGLRPMIWDDMFFSAYSRANPDSFRIPDGIDSVYWDYYNNTEAHYTENIEIRGKIAKHMIFAGGAWKWIGYTPHHSKTLVSTNAALAACKKKGVREVIVTAWGDDGTECPVSACLYGCVLFGEHGYQEEVPLEEFKKRLEFITGMSYDTFMKEEEFDILPSVEDRTTVVTPSKYLFYEDLLCSFFVHHAKDMPEDTTSHYQSLADYFEVVAKEQTNDVLRATCEFYCAYANVLQFKWNLGRNIYEAYQKKDKEKLKTIIEVQINPLFEFVESMRAARMKEWNLSNKTFGFEVLDLRFGGIKQRLETTKYRLEEYLAGNVETIEELEEVRIPVVNFREQGMGEIIHFNQAQKSMTASKMIW